MQSPPPTNVQPLFTKKYKERRLKEMTNKKSDNVLTKHKNIVIEVKRPELIENKNKEDLRKRLDPALKRETQINKNIIEVEEYIPNEIDNSFDEEYMKYFNEYDIDSNNSITDRYLYLNCSGSPFTAACNNPRFI